MADIENVSITIINLVTLDTKKSELTYRPLLSPGVTAGAVTTASQVMVDTGIRASLGISNQFINAFTRPDGTAAIPSTKGRIGANATNAPVRDFPTTISGVVTEDGTAIATRLRLYSKESGFLVEEVMSAPDGTYTFNEVSTGHSYFIVAFDEQGPVFKAPIIIDNIQK